MTTVDVPRKLVAKDDGGQFTHLVVLPVRHLALSNVQQVLLKEQSDFSVYFGTAAEPALHHGRRHFGVSVPFVVWLHVSLIKVSAGGRHHLIVRKLRPLA